MGMFDGKKSGDSKRQDGEKARAEDQKTDATPAEKAAALPELVQDAADKAAEGGASPDKVANMQKMIDQLSRTVEALQKRVDDGAGAGKYATPEALLPKYVTCGACGQYVSLCKGKHTTIYVIPSQSENMEGFNGITRNGVRYFGTSIVPTCMAESLKCDVANYETYKKKSRFDLGKIRGWDRDIALAMGQSTKDVQAQLTALG